MRQRRLDREMPEIEQFFMELDVRVREVGKRFFRWIAQWCWFFIVLEVRWRERPGGWRGSG